MIRRRCDGLVVLANHLDNLLGAILISAVLAVDTKAAATPVLLPSDEIALVRCECAIQWRR